MTTKPLWYLAHPVAPDEGHTLKQNIRDGQEWWAFLTRAGFMVTAPWIGLCLTLDDNDETDRKIGMEVDLAVLRRCDGLIHTGHTVSNGMRIEEATMHQLHRPVVTAVGYVRNLEAISLIQQAEERMK